jgi:hypothetical protein
MYAVVYCTGRDPETPNEIAFVKYKFFRTQKKAWNWFVSNYRVNQYNHPHTITVEGFDRLTFEHEISKTI